MSGEAAARMSKSRQKWQAAVGSLWQPGGPRLTELLGDTVAAIKAEKDPIAAENILNRLLSSPKSRELRVQASSTLIPRKFKGGLEKILDAADVGFGPARSEIKAATEVVVSHFGASTVDLVPAVSRLAKKIGATIADDAHKSANMKRGQRARRQFGLQRKSGRLPNPDADRA
jgi:hypothetical protein